MKKTLLQIVILGTAMSLVGCSYTNTTGQNTVLGAVGGGVLGGVVGGAVGGGVGAGVGILAGALVGGAIGNSMDSVDKRHFYEVVEDGRPGDWVSTRTHYRYVVVPSRHYVAYHGHRYCRSFTTVAYIGHHKHRLHGVACRQPNGSWMAVR